MFFRPLSILLTAIIAFHALFGGAGDVAVLCFGGGHQHGPAETEHCESACEHGTSCHLPIPAGDHEHECGCTDVEFAVAELISLPRGDDGSASLLIALPSSAWGIVVHEAGLGRRGPPMPPTWFDPSGDQRLAIVASVVLTL